MLQFLKKAGRKQQNMRSSSFVENKNDVANINRTGNCRSSFSTRTADMASSSPILLTSIDDNADDDTLLLIKIENFCKENNKEYNGTHQSFSKNIHQIVSDKNYLSYFIQFLDSQKALPLIKFWLDAESFKIAAEQCTNLEANLSDICHLKMNGKHDDDSMTADKMNLKKSISLDFDHYHHHHNESIASLMCDKSLIDSSICEQSEDRNSISSLDYENLPIDVQDLCDMVGKSLTDDEKSQLCEQNILKQQQQQKQQQYICNKTKPLTNKEPKSIKSIERNAKCSAVPQTSLATDAIRIFKKYLTTKSTYCIDMPATILSAISLAICSNDADGDTDGDDVDDTIDKEYQSIGTIFVEAQHYVLERLDKVYLTPFIESSFYCKYCVDILTGDNLKIRDILHCETLLFYFMEFLEQSNKRHLLDFWIAAINFKTLFKIEEQSNTESYSKQQAQKDALILYEKYFSLQATNSLRMSDSIRYQIEERICSENDDEPITNCFDLPLNVIERYLDLRYFKTFLTSNLFDKYLSELLHKCDGKITINRQHSLKLTQKQMSKFNRHRKTYSDCSSDKLAQYRSMPNVVICKINTAHPIGSATASAPFQSSPTPSDLHIDQLCNPDLLWHRRHSLSANHQTSGLQFGRVDALGRYERDFELDPLVDRSAVTTTSNKFKQAVRKLVNLPEDKAQEEIAWQVAEMIVKDITNVTLNYKKRSNSTSE